MGTKKLQWYGLLVLVLAGACRPKHEVELRRINDIVVDATTEPILRAKALLYNPNNLRMTLKRIDMDVFVDDKKSAMIRQDLKTKIPARAEFTVPLEVKLNLKELGFMDTVFAVLGGKKMKIRYKGSLRLTYKGIPITVPVDYTDEIRVRL